LSSDLRRRYSTANEFITLDQIDAETGALDSIAFLYEAARGTVAVCGGSAPLLQPVLIVDGERQVFTDARWVLLDSWIPVMRLEHPAGVLECTYLAPPERRGMLARLSFRSAADARVELAFELNWGATQHVSDSTRVCEGVRRVGVRGEDPPVIHLEFSAIWPLYGIGVTAGDGAEWEVNAGGVPLPGPGAQLNARQNEVVVCRLAQEASLTQGGFLECVAHIGLGLEAYGGVTSAMDLLNEGWAALFESTRAWLLERRIECTGRAEPFSEKLNQHAVYNLLFCHGVTLDTERIAVTSSRSPRYDLTGSYGDRDACLYSIPAAAMIDASRARRMLEYCFSVQMRNIGAFCRYLDGVPLKPGFALDALVAPLRSLWTYVALTGDNTILFDRAVQSGVNRILETLENNSHESAALYRTRLSPAGRTVTLPYLTYSNVLVWRALTDLSDLYNRIRDVEREHETALWARDVRAAVLRHCVVDGPHGPMFCFATDLNGDTHLGSEPEGSLLVLAHLEFCRPDFAPFRNTLQWVREHNNLNLLDRRSVLVMANELLSGNLDVLTSIESLSMDEGIACGTVDDDGIAESGPAWAACGGFLAYAFVRALEEHVSIPSLARKPEGHRRISRSTMRPGVGWV